MKEKMLELLKSINREGIDKLISFLEKTDFFEAPASTRFHGSYAGGLVEHSIKVYEILCENAKNKNGEWEKVPYYTVDDTIPYGHGEKSVMMISEFMPLTNEEKYAIRWHMGFTEPKELYSTIGAAYKKYPLALLLFESDLESTYFFDI